MTRHLLEQHSGFSYKCLNCKKIVPRLKKHPGCNAGKASMRLFHRNTGKTGTEAQAMLDGYKSTMDQFFEETSRFARVPAKISPIKDPLPGRVNRLEGLYKRKSTFSFSVPPKRNFGWRQRPVIRRQCWSQQMNQTGAMTPLKSS